MGGSYNIYYTDPRGEAIGLITLLCSHSTQVAKGNEPFQQPISLSSNGSRYSGDYGATPRVGPNGWAVAGNSAPQAPLALASFVEISRSQPRPMPGVADNKWDAGSRNLSHGASSQYTLLVQPSKSEHSDELTAKGTTPHCNLK